MLQNTDVFTNNVNMELKDHGTEAFPCAGYEEFYSPSGYELPWHWHSEMELIYIKKGRLDLQVESSLLYLEKGSLTFLNSNILHAAKGDGVLQSFVFSPLLVTGRDTSAFAMKYITPLEKSSSLPCFVISKPSRELLGDFKEAFEALRDDKPGFEFQVRNILSRVLFSIYSENEMKIMENQGERDKDSVRLGAMLSYIYNNYSEDITLGDLAAVAGVSGREVLRCFDRMIGQSPIQYIIRYRLHRSVNMMAVEREKSLSGIASECGFVSSSYYTKKFREVYGVTPKVYRDRIGTQRQSYEQGN